MKITHKNHMLNDVELIPKTKKKIKQKFLQQQEIIYRRDKHMIYKIINKKIPDSSRHIIFGDLQPGALFKLGDDLFMKMKIQFKMVNGVLMQCLTDPNAVNLDNGEPIHIENFIPIEHYVGDVTFDNDKFEGIKW